MNTTKKYRNSIILGIIITVFISIGVKLNNYTIVAIGGLLFSVPIRLFWKSYMEPELKIDSTDINPIYKVETINNLRYKKCMIRIKNTGKSFAKNCKGYRYNSIINPYRKKRVCWTIQSERPNATINSGGEETIDFCAFYLPESNEKVDANIQNIIFPNESGWNHPSDDGDLGHIDNNTEYGILITAGNAKPIKKIIRFNIASREIMINLKD